MDYLAELADEYFRYVGSQHDLAVEQFEEELKQKLASFGAVDSSQMRRELAINLLHENPRCAALINQKTSLCPLFIQRLADDAMSRLESQSAGLRLSIAFKRYTNWFLSDAISPPAPAEAIKELVKKRKNQDLQDPLLDLRDFLSKHGLELETLYEFLANPNKSRDLLRARLRVLVLGDPELRDGLVERLGPRFRSPWH